MNVVLHAGVEDVADLRSSMGFAFGALARALLRGARAVLLRVSPSFPAQVRLRGRCNAGATTRTNIRVHQLFIPPTFSSKRQLHFLADTAILYLVIRIGVKFTSRITLRR